MSGGSKAHWLARSFSEAFLVRSTAGHAVGEAAPEKIVQRLLDVLEKAAVTLSRKDNGPLLSTTPEAAPRRFEFLHNSELRAVIERAYTDSRRALDQGQYDAALRMSCGILEAIVTDTLEHVGLDAISGCDAPPGKIADWPFESRLQVAEKAGLIRGGCARLPAVARMYRDESSSEMAVSERDARRASQVLHVVMRDLNPGR